MVSLTGLPPTAGFIGKFYIFASLIQGGGSFYWLVVIGGVNSVVSLYYYLRVVKVMYFDGDRKDSLVSPPKVLTGMLLATAVPTMVLGIYWVPIAKWIKEGKIVYKEDIVTGLENAPEAFIGLMNGKNFGKLLIKVSE